MIWKKEVVQMRKKRIHPDEFGLQSPKKIKKKLQVKKSHKKKPRLTAEQSKKRKQKKQLKQITEYLFIGLLFLGIIYTLITTKTHIVNGKSMYPTLDAKDCLIIKKTKKVERYDIITFDPIDPPDISYVKRIIGIPGDKLKIRNNQLYHTIPSFEKAKEDEFSDCTVILSLTEKKAVERLEKLETIPTDHYLVIGDNRGNSKDSRAFGLIEKKQIDAKCL